MPLVVRIEITVLRVVDLLLAPSYFILIPEGLGLGSTGREHSVAGTSHEKLCGVCILLNSRKG